MEWHWGKDHPWILNQYLSQVFSCRLWGSCFQSLGSQPRGKAERKGSPLKWLWSTPASQDGEAQQAMWKNDPHSVFISSPFIHSCTPRGPSFPGLLKTPFVQNPVDRSSPMSWISLRSCPLSLKLFPWPLKLFHSASPFLVSGLSFLFLDSSSAYPLRVAALKFFLGPLSSVLPGQAHPVSDFNYHISGENLQIFKSSTDFSSWEPRNYIKLNAEHLHLKISYIPQN